MPATKVGVLNEDHPMYREGFDHTAVCECGFASFGWPTVEQAQLRSEQHQNEHDHQDEIRAYFDAGNLEEANKFLMPPIAEVQALTPDAFPENVVSPTSNDVNSAWDAVN